MSIALLDLTRQYKQIKNEVAPLINSIIESQRFVNGPIVEEFEQNFAKFCNTKHAIGCSSGTDALLMSLMSLDVGPGDEVITTPFTFISTVEAIVRVGATPVFVDIDPETYNMDTSLLENSISKKTKAIIPVHIFGQCSNMNDVMRFAQKYDLFVIEDSAQAVGSMWGKKKAGSFGTVGCFSFFPSKNLGAFGDGGIVTTDDTDLYQKMLRMRQHGIDAKNPYFYEHVGGNFRLDALQAGVLNIKLKYIDEWQSKRRKNASFYNENISGVTLPKEHENAFHVYNQYTIRSSERDSLRQLLVDKKIGCSIYYPHPLHVQSYLLKFGYKLGDMPVCEQVCKEVLSIPIYPELTRGELEIIAREINSK